MLIIIKVDLVNPKYTCACSPVPALGQYILYEVITDLSEETFLLAFRWFDT